MDSLYNAKEKQEFLNTLEKDSVKVIYSHMFSKVKGIEEFYEKDLYSFTLSQIESAMQNINPATESSSHAAKSRINNYISWAIKNGRRENNINPLYKLPVEWNLQFINKDVKRYLSKKEIDLVVSDLRNAQDQALIQCIFEGIMGRGLSEILSLRYSKINWDSGIATVYDQRTDKERDVQLSSTCLRYIENAYNQQYYITETPTQELEKELVPFEDYIFKNVIWRSSKFSRVTRANLSKRINNIKEEYELEEFSVMTINESGRIHMAYLIAKENNNKLEKEDFAKVGDKYNLPKHNSNDYEYYNTYVMKNYINSDNIKNLYGTDVEIE